MARIRTIKPEFPQSESIGRLSREGRLCFILLWTLADDSGRLRGNSRMLASLLYPYDDDAKKHIDGWIEELERENCIVRYQVDGETYIQICNWLKHQKIDKPSASKIPPIPEGFAKPREDSKKNAADQGRDQGPKDQRTKDQGNSVAIATGGKPPTDPAKEEIWRTGKAILAQQGDSMDSAGSFLGKLCKDYGNLLVLQAVRDCAATTPAQAKEWLVARCQERRAQSGNKAAALEQRNRAAVEQALMEAGHG